MKRWLVFFSVGIGLHLSSLQADELINKQNGFIAAELHEDEAIIHDRFLEDDLERRGIEIPETLRDQYDGRTTVFMNDDLFQKAFREVYYEMKLNHEVFALRSEEKGIDQANESQTE